MNVDGPVDSGLASSGLKLLSTVSEVPGGCLSPSSRLSEMGRGLVKSLHCSNRATFRCRSSMKLYLLSIGHVPFV